MPIQIDLLLSVPVGSQPFRNLLEGRTRCWGSPPQPTGCGWIGCQYVGFEQTWDGDWDSWCEGYVSERAAVSCFDRYCDDGAECCRIYQIEHGKRYPNE